MKKLNKFFGFAALVIVASLVITACMSNAVSIRAESNLSSARTGSAQVAVTTAPATPNNAAITLNAPELIATTT